ncbi:MAG: hypothetical protein HC929_03530 [Leptolyngbyaceae cyanobacterium SM2_5_2]|nr:hypothetical protein [Leptolyngbyaceae cyanobacterium SM2_5_2]
MFSPTHVLISRTKQTPVQLVASPKGYQLYTEQEWQAAQTPAFELRSKLGFFCRGIQVVGFRLEPMAAVASAVAIPQGAAIPQ